MPVEMIVRNVLIDIDGTLTYQRNPRSLKGPVNYPNMILTEMLAEKLRVPLDEALEKVINAEEPCGRKDAFFAVRNNPQWGITEDVHWNKCVQWQKKHLFFYKDAIYMVKELKKKGFTLFIASNNGVKAILLKLSRARLATRDGSQCFSGLFGDDLAGCQKNNPDYFRRLVERTKIVPEESVMIGDSIEQDFLMPREAGFNKVIIINRKQKERILRQEAVFVNSLKTVPRILKLGTNYSSPKGG
jgi:HAD superfamily hydrolase (TIGR01549 family)